LQSYQIQIDDAAADTSAREVFMHQRSTATDHQGSTPYSGAVPPQPSRGDDSALRHARAAIEILLGPSAERSIDVQYWDGSIEHGRLPTPAYRLCVNRRGALRRMLLPPNELSIVEAYISGDVDIDGSLEAAMGLPDELNARLRSPRALATLARHLMALPAHDALAPAVHDARSARVVQPVGRQHEPERDRAAIHYHYDVGNDFYSLWLDERMVYSCAYFRTPTDTLDDAQRAKLDLVCRKLRLKPGDRLLDVGCGWGALILHAAQHYGVIALGITLSENQAELARERINAAGLRDRCRVDLRDYRSLPPDAQFDKIASVGMVEHVGVDHLPEYFSALYRALAPAGLLLNHGIVSVNAARPTSRFDWIERRLWKRDAFIDQYVFPDGRLGPIAAVIAAAERSGFETRDMESLREHYALTLRAWVSRLLQHRDRAIELVGERVFRIWRLYMTASAHAFTTGSINVVQTLLAKPDASGKVALPLTRNDVLNGL
jgi:cyclopropane-fatty-acyl-phospholipid synthase